MTGPKSELRALPLPGTWSGPPKQNRRVLVMVVFIVVPFLGIGVALLMGNERAKELFPLAVVWASLAVWSGHWAFQSRRVRPADRALLQGEDTFLVEIHIVPYGIQTGQDRGVLFRDGEALCFNGYATSFRVGSQDVVPRASWDGFVMIGSDPKWLKLPLIVDKKPMWIGLELLSASPRRRALRRFRDFIDDFVSSAPADGVRQLPPLERPPKRRGKA